MDPFFTACSVVGIAFSLVVIAQALIVPSPKWMSFGGLCLLANTFFLIRGLS